MRVVLAEKPSVARELASFLGARTRADGYFEGQGYQVTWAFGHLVTLKEPEDYDPALLRRGRSQVLKGFKSKSGRAFDARLKLDQGVVRFDFES
jgi:DNA topoisomerase IA